MNLPTYEEIIIMALVGGLFATSVFPGYFMMAIPQNKQIEDLKEAIRWKNTTESSD